MHTRVAVIAIGGNSLIRDRQHQTVHDQYEAARDTCAHILGVIRAGWSVVLSHGNGPQVGFILRRSELAAHELHEVPLDVCVADSQGAIGYALQQNLYDLFQQHGIHRQVVTVVTQVEVDPDDPAFRLPAKPIGSFMDEAQAARRRAEGWAVVEDAGRGWRRVAPSPAPVRIVELEAIRALLAAGFVVIAAGGGGIPVVADAHGRLRGVAAVVDKDLSSALLATAVGAELLLISTAVEKVALGYGTPAQQWLDRLSLAEARAYLAEGTHFAAGSMAPKIQAAISFLEQGGQRVIITRPESLERALNGETGTHIIA